MYSVQSYFTSILSSYAFQTDFVITASESNRDLIYMHMYMKYIISAHI